MKAQNSDNTLSLLEKLSKGGVGSGVRGHKTARDPKAQKNKLQNHLEMLKQGGVIPGVSTQSGKPIVTSIKQARIHQYSSQDHMDAVNAHYELAERTQKTLDKLTASGLDIPKEGKEIAKFHLDKMKEHMVERNRTEDQTERKKRAMESYAKKEKVEKAVTMVGEGQEGADIDTGNFATARAHADPELLQKLYETMQNCDFGDVRDLDLDKGKLHLAKVDDGLYTGYFTTLKPVEGGELEDNSKIRIERITVPDLAQLIDAKEWNGIPQDVDAEPEVEKFNVGAIPAAFSENAPEDADYAALTEKLAGPPEDTPIEAPSVEQKIRLLELVNKLIS